MIRPRPPFRALGAVLVLAGGITTAAATEPDDDPLVAPIHVDDAGLPRPGLTPGDALPGAKAKALCADLGDSRPHLPSAALCDGAFARYRIPPERRFQYACRYLIPLSIGGAATELNTWPQIVAEATLKDTLDRDLARRVCQEEVSPALAQREIAADWINAYRRYLIPDDPAPFVAPRVAEREPGEKPRSRPDGAYAMPTDSGAGVPPIVPGIPPDYPQGGGGGPSASPSDSQQPADNRRRRAADNRGPMPPQITPGVPRTGGPAVGAPRVPVVRNPRPGSARPHAVARASRRGGPNRR